MYQHQRITPTFFLLLSTFCLTAESMETSGIAHVRPGPDLQSNKEMVVGEGQRKEVYRMAPAGSRGKAALLLTRKKWAGRERCA
jgi:hypothetical protein